MHRVIHHREIITVKQGLDGVKIEDGFQKCNMLTGGWDDLNNYRGTPVCRYNGS